MEQNIGLYTCNQTDCDIEKTGRCVNGLQDCEHKILISVTNESFEEAGNDQDDKKIALKSTTQIPWGTRYDDTNISDITYRYKSRIILLVGEPSSGKSTLYAALFDTFQKGICANYLFCGTKTPIGFEEICHLARQKSKGKIPITERTKSYEFTYLHLAVRDSGMGQDVEHLIFADVNGERFQDVKNNDDDAQKLSIMKRADHIFFIADGGLLLKNGDKHVVKDDVWKTIRRCYQNQMINKSQNVTLVVTKWDEITAAGKVADVNDFFIAPTLRQFTNILSNVIRVASRSLIDAVPPRTGIDAFLTSCLTPVTYNFEYNYVPKIKRQFQNFKYCSNNG